MDELPPPLAASMRKAAEEATNASQEGQLLQDRAHTLLKKAYVLGVLTGSEVVLLFSFKGEVISYASPQLEPLITEKQAKDLFTNLLYGQKKRSDEPLAAKSADEQIIKEPSSAETSNTPQAELAREESQEELDAASYIEDDAEREKAFKARYVHLHNECVKVSVLAHPEEGADVFLLVATPSSKIFSFTTPKLQPMIKTPIGQNMIKTFLNAKPLPTPPAHTCASHSQV